MEGETQLTSLEGGLFVGHGKDFLFSLCNHCGFVFWKRAELRLFRRVQPGGGLSEDQKVNEEGYKHGCLYLHIRPQQLSFKFTIKDIVEVDTDKHKISFSILTYINWHEPQVSCRREVHWPSNI